MSMYGVSQMEGIVSIDKFMRSILLDFLYNIGLI